MFFYDCHPPSFQLFHHEVGVLLLREIFVTGKSLILEGYGLDKVLNGKIWFVTFGGVISTPTDYLEFSFNAPNCIMKKVVVRVIRNLFY